jgi:hypothetical protein
MKYRTIAINSFYVIFSVFSSFAIANGASMFQGSNGRSADSQNKVMMVVLATLLPLILSEVTTDTYSTTTNDKAHRGRPKGTKTVKRERRDAEKLFLELSDHGFRRMYRMSRASFWKLHNIIQLNMPNPRKRKN